MITGLDVSAYTVPTDRPEGDGTLTWDATTMVLVRAHTDDGSTGLGYTYGHACLTSFIEDVLTPAVTGLDVCDTGAAWQAMVHAIRNHGRPGLASMAIAAVDTALWDAKARLLGRPLHRVLGASTDSVPVYGSGGFTTYSEAELIWQLTSWASQGIPRVKMKVGRDDDVARARAVREALGPDIELFVDANGAYDRTQAASMGRAFAEEAGVKWFEEPVTSDDLAGLAALARSLPLDVTAGEYGYHLEYFQAMLGSVDVIQADITRCAGVTEWLRVADAAAAAKIPLSAHCAPALHAHVCCVPANVRHIEYFHDHVRIENLFFDNVLKPVDGCLWPTDAPGNGLEFKEPDAARYRVR
jgi:L-alanine-DL-glutamate epimerase-like enolase superfamily enzyme